MIRSRLSRYFPVVLLALAGTPAFAQSSMRPSDEVFSLYHDTNRLAAAQGSAMAPAFLVQALLESPDITAALERVLGPKAIDKLRTRITIACTPAHRVFVPDDLAESPNADLAQLAGAAEQEAIDAGATQVLPRHLLLALLRTREEAKARRRPEPPLDPREVAELTRMYDLLQELVSGDSSATALARVPDVRVLESAEPNNARLQWAETGWADTRQALIDAGLTPQLLKQAFP